MLKVVFSKDLMSLGYSWKIGISPMKLEDAEPKKTMSMHSGFAIK